MNRVFFAAAIFAMAASASFAEPRTVTWIGEASGELLSASNWDPALEFPDGDKNWSDWARITNTVEFTENTDKYFWRNSRLSISGNSTVTFKARFWTATEKYLTADKETYVDIEKGSTLVSSMMIGGIKTCTFVKTGGGTLEGYNIGSFGNLYNKIRILEGTVKLSGNLNNALRACSGIEIGSSAKVILTVANSIDTDSADARALVKVDGILDVNSKAQTMDGLCGSGVITNAKAGITLQMRAQAQNVFTGRIHGALNVAPVADAPVDACLVIGDADTLKYTDLSVVETERHPNPLKFKPGIGVFYARTFPKGKRFFDTNGNEVELRNYANHLYVNCSVEASGDGLTPTSAYKTLKEALESDNLKDAPELNIIHVAPGTYDAGEMGSGTDLSRAVVPGNVHLVADDKSEGATLIVGKASDKPPANCRGCGEGAVRCVKLLSGARIEGFTLTGGHTYVETSTSGKTGGGVECADYACYIVDCVISNNVAYRGGGGHKGTYVRTKILFNYATQIGSGLYEGCHLYNCAVNGNDGTGFYSAGSRSLLVNCIFGPDGTSIRADGTAEDARSDAYNTIFMSSILSNGNNAGQKMRLHNCLTMDNVPGDVDVDDDCIQMNGFANAQAKMTYLGLNESFAPVAAVPGDVIDRGRRDYCFVPGTEAFDLDIAGNPRVVGPAVDLGPYEMRHDRTLLGINDVDVGIAVEGADKGLQELNDGEELTFTLRRTFDSDYLCKGFTVNGVYVDFDDYPNGWTAKIDGGDLTRSLVIEAVYAKENKTFYVDAENGDDKNRGYHIACPKKTLAAAFTPTPAVGSVVYAAPGYYTNGVMEVATTSYGMQQCRVVVPPGVSLISLADADSTFIGGESSKNPPADNTFGCGPGSVRCVTMMSEASRIKGFTCFDGRVNCSDNDSGAYGGGVQGPGIVEDCVFINCAATRGGGVSQATAVRRCRFVDCGASYLGSAITECKGVYNCVFDACTNGGYVALYSMPIVNCVFMPSCTPNTAVYYISENDERFPYLPTNVINSAIFCAPFPTNAKIPMYTNCAFMRVSNIEEDIKGEGSVILEANRVNVLDVAKMNADGSLQKGSPLVDIGSNELYRTEMAGTGDLAKGQRIYNARIDIGAYEYDWRGEFSRAIGHSRSFSLSEASENVTLAEGGGVLLRGGESIGVVWDRPGSVSRDLSFDVDCSGEGNLTYSFGGESFTVAVGEGKKTVSLKGISGRLELSIAFAGEGSATISGFKRADNGVMLLLR